MKNHVCRDTVFFRCPAARSTSRQQHSEHRSMLLYARPHHHMNGRTWNCSHRVRQHTTPLLDTRLLRFGGQLPPSVARVESGPMLQTRHVRTPTHRDLQLCSYKVLLEMPCGRDTSRRRYPKITFLTHLPGLRLHRGPILKSGDSMTVVGSQDDS